MGIFFFSPLQNRGFAAEVFDAIGLPPIQKHKKLGREMQASVYYPPRLVIGKDNKFVIKGKPGSKVSLAVSSAGHGSPPMYGQSLRLGQIEQTIEGEIPPTGVLEMIYSLPSDEQLIDQTKFVEVALWQDESFKDIEIARIYSATGRATDDNSLVIAAPPTDGGNSAFTPMLPGLSQDFYRVVDEVKKFQQGKINPDLVDDDGNLPAFFDSLHQRDLMLQNMEAPGQTNDK